MILKLKNSSIYTGFALKFNIGIRTCSNFGVSASLFFYWLILLPDQAKALLATHYLANICIYMYIYIYMYVIIPSMMQVMIDYIKKKYFFHLWSYISTIVLHITII